MRVGLVVPGGVDPSGRTRVIPALLWLIEALAERHEVDVHVLFHSGTPRTYEIAGARVFDLGLLGSHPIPGLGFVRGVGALRRSLAENGPPDVIHAFWAGTPGYAAGRAGRALGRPMLLSLGGGELVALRDIRYGAGISWRGRWVVKRSLALADAVTAASAPMIALARTHGIEAEPVPLGVKTNLFAGPPAPEGPPFRLLHVADLNPVKDQETLLRATARIAREVPEVHLDVVGRDTMAGAVQRRAADLGLETRVTFHGFLPTDEIVPFFRRAHLLVHSSRHEAGPLVALEAAAAGLPTVGTAVGHLVDLAPDAAVSVPVGDDAALAREAVSLLLDPTRRAALGGRARDWAAAHDAAWTAARFSEIYGRLAGRETS